MIREGEHILQNKIKRPYFLPSATVVAPCAPSPGRFYEIQSMSGRYASYWNAFLFEHDFPHATNITKSQPAGFQHQGFCTRVTVCALGHILWVRDAIIVLLTTEEGF